VAVAVAAGNAAAQVTSSTDWAWKPIVSQKGVSIEYLFYSEKGPKDEGVVLKIINTGAQAANYDFVIIFKGQDSVAERRVSGRVGPKRFITGESEGLYWTPFERGISIGEIGIRGLKIK